MRHMTVGYRGLATFMSLNIDRALATGATVGAILLATWLQTH